MFKIVKKQDFSSVDGIESYKLCYIDSIDRTIYDYDDASKKIMESDGYKAEEERIRIQTDKDLAEKGYSSYSPYNNKYFHMLRTENVPNPEYVVGEASHYAYFTPINLDKQWGDDWDDAPYEHNAERPYDTYYVDGKRNEFTVLQVPFYLPIINRGGCYFSANTPESYGYGGNSPFCVRDINMGAIPWLWVCYSDGDKNSDGESVKFDAGINPIEFVNKMEKADAIYHKWLDSKYSYDIEKTLEEEENEY